MLQLIGRDLCPFFRINEHEVGHPAGYKPLMVLDVWEHAFIKVSSPLISFFFGLDRVALLTSDSCSPCQDYAPAERPKYIDAFLKQANWEIAEARFQE